MSFVKSLEKLETKEKSSEEFIKLFRAFISQNNYYMIKSLINDSSVQQIIQPYFKSISYASWRSEVVQPAVKNFVSRTSKTSENIMNMLCYDYCSRGTIVKKRLKEDEETVTCIFDYLCDTTHSEKFNLMMYELCGHHGGRKPTVIMPSEAFHIHINKAAKNDDVEYFNYVMQMLGNDAIDFWRHFITNSTVVPVKIIQSAVMCRTISENSPPPFSIHSKDFYELIRVLLWKQRTGCYKPEITADFIVNMLSPAIHCRVRATSVGYVGVLGHCIEHMSPEHKYELKWWFTEQWLKALPFHEARQVIIVFVDHEMMKDDVFDMPFLDVMPRILEEAADKTGMDVYYCKEQVKRLSRWLSMKRFISSS